MKTTTTLPALLFLFLGLGNLAFASSKDWTKVSISKLQVPYPNYIKTKKAEYLKLDLTQLKAEFALSPKERPEKLRKYGKIISLPMPNGTEQKFAFCSYDMMEEGLKGKWDFVRTYTGQGIDDPTATCKIDFTSFGFHSQILSANGDFYIDPIFHGNSEFYQVYNKEDLIKTPEQAFRCEVESSDHSNDQNKSGGPVQVQATGDIRRVYRTAIATTAEYTSFHGGAIQAASAVVTSLNRVNGVYEKELSVRLILVANNNLLINTSVNGDPFTNSSGPTMLGQNQTYITTTIGATNFDIGHVFSTGGGGIAGLGVVCSSSQKARGVTGSNSPVGDPFNIDYVAHEMGHQFAGEHTFNSESGSCSGNRSSTCAYEPGSGTTIMAYAGICSPEDLQTNSNAYFVFKSYEQIAQFTNFNGGNSCPVKQNTGNTAPTIPALSTGFTIPINTPFKLTAPQATDPDGDTLTFCWEQFDLGPSGIPSTATGNAPILRSFSPVTSRERIFPRPINLLVNTANIGERLPSYARGLKFKLTVRDNNGGAGGVNSSSMTMTVNATGGAFAITSPNTNGLVYEGGSSQTITWNAGSTASAPFNVPKVRIKFSSDGGNNFNTILLDSTENDGTAQVVMPIIVSSTCRILVEPLKNVFFDINNFNFRLTAPSTANIPLTVTDTALCVGTSFSASIAPTGTVYNAGNIFTLQLSDATGSFASPVSLGNVTGTTSAVITGTIPLSTASGTNYKLRIISSNPVRTGTNIINAPKIKGLPAQLSAISGVSTFCANDSNKIFQVTAVPGLSGYSWTLPAGASIQGNATGNSISVRFGSTGGNITIKGINSCGTGPESTLPVVLNVVQPALVTVSPTASSICVGSPVTFTANPTNGGQTPAYKWLKNNIEISGATSVTYTTSALVTGDKFSCILISSLSCGSENIDTSTQVTMTVNQKRTPTSTIESNALNDTSCTGETLTFTSLNNNAGGTNASYAWFKNLTQIPNQTTNTLVISNLISTDSIRLRLTVAGSCLTANSVFSPGKKTAIINLTANAGPDTTVCPGVPTNIPGKPAGGSWTGASIAPGGVFTGTAGSNVTYTINKYGCIRTDTRLINVFSVPAVSFQVDGLTLTATAQGAVTYVWLLNDNPIPGSNSSSITITETGLYCVEAIFPNGCKNKSTCLLVNSASGLESTRDGAIGIFPNPTQNQVEISWNIDNQIKDFQILNQIGQLVTQFKVSPDQTSISLELKNYPKGIYHVIGLTGNGNRISKSIVKE